MTGLFDAETALLAASSACANARDYAEPGSDLRFGLSVSVVALVDTALANLRALRGMVDSSA